MQRRTLLRIGLLGFGVTLAIMAVAFYFRWPLVENIWPWGGYEGEQALSPLSFYFLSSIAAAIGAPIIWIALSDKLHAVAAGALDLTLSLAGIGIFMFQGYLDSPRSSSLLIGAVIMVIGVISNLALYAFTRKIPLRDPRPVPLLVRVSYGVFILALVVVGSSLVLKRPLVLPWSVTVEASVVYGWLFLGAAIYFFFALLKPSWENATGQLLGFLAYDIVLIVPFLSQLGTVSPVFRTNLIIYTIVVSYSGLLAIYFLFIHRPTRLFRGIQPETAANPQEKTAPI